MIASLVRALSLGLLLFMVPAHAEARKHQEQSAPMFDWHAVHSIGSEALIGERAARKVRTARQHSHRRFVRVEHPRRERSSETHEAQLLPHPSGCPARAFCGCGAAIEVFGRNIREAWLAAWWFRFPVAAPAPGMVAVRRHHVFVIREVRGPGLVLAYDANSGGHRTRLHLRSLAGYSVRDPRGSRYATAG